MLKLLYRRGAEGIPRGQHDRAPLILKAPGELADAGGFAHAVDAHHENHKRRGDRHVQRLFTGGENGLQLIAQGLHQHGGLIEFPARNTLGELADNLAGGLDAHVGHEQLRFEFFEKVRVDALAAQKQRAQAPDQAVAGAPQALPEAGEETVFARPVLGAPRRRGCRRGRGRRRAGAHGAIADRVGGLVGLFFR